MTDDLVAKLRDEDSYYRLQEKHWCIDAEELERQRLAAADRIEALCRAIEQHEAFRQEVSDAVIAFMMDKPGLSGKGITRFIIAKPDPLVEAMQEWWDADGYADIETFRAAIEKRGGKIVWGEG